MSSDIQTSHLPEQLRGTIVIAEDDVATRMLLCQVLTREHFRVIAVGNGQLACEAVRREHPDVVLLDWRMPVMDGRAALEELKASKETRGIPIVMLTSRSQVDERIIALESGVQDFLSKPFDPRELVACIEQQLRWQHGLAVDANAAFLEERNALLATSERRYRMLAEAMPHMVWLADASGNMTYVNRAWSDYIGTTIEQIRPEGWASALHPDDRASALHAWSRALASGEPFELQCRYLRAADDMYRWHLARATPTSDPAGSIVEWVGSCADIHDYKIANETRTLLDTIANIVSIRNEAGFVDYTSPFWSQYTGTTPDSGLGFGWRDRIHPEDLRRIEGERAEVGTSSTAAHSYEMRILGHDGRYRWFLSQSTMLPDIAGAARRWLDTATNVDDLKRTQSALENSEARYRALADSMPQLVWVVDATSQYEYVNHRWSEYTGYSLEQTQAAGNAAIVDAEGLATLDGLSASPVLAECTCEIRFRRHDGVFRWHLVRAVPFHDVVGDTRKWIGTAVDIEDSKAAAAQLANAAAELQHLAHHDPLTNLPNRVLLVERLAQAIALAQRGKTGVIVLYLDLDRFKIINDTLGHAAGDVVLAVTGKRIADALRAGDTASRVGGDEFVLVCTTSDAAEDASRVAARLVAAIGQPIDVDGEPVCIGASIGISLYPADGTTGDELIEKADAAMYAAKQSGRNAFRFYGADAHTSLVASFDFETELREAVAHGQIVVAYQPILGCDSGRIIGAEALVCWQHPRRGLLVPAEFLAFAEEHRLMGAIGAIALDAICARIAELGTTVDVDFSIAMSVSARQFGEPGFVATIAAAIATHRIDPRHIAIEVSEHIILGQPAAAMRVLAEINALGVRLSIDDFGTGYRSLLSVQSSLHALKIDRAFVHDVGSNAVAARVGKTIVNLAHSLAPRVVAEGSGPATNVADVEAFEANAFAGYVADEPMTGPALSAYIARRATERQ